MTDNKIIKYKKKIIKLPEKKKRKKNLVYIVCALN